jgi:uncharacterized membrane protein
MATRNASKVVLASAVAGLLAMGAMAANPQAASAAEKVKCYGANKCKGTGSCAGPAGCAGKNACKGQGFVEVDSKEACLKMEGGRLTPEKK